MLNFVEMYKLFLSRRPRTEIELQMQVSATFADKYAECQYRISRETDELKKSKMEARLALGVTDFSDI